MAGRLNAWQFRQLIERDGVIEAAKRANPSVKTKLQAELVVFKYCSQLLSVKEYEAAAIVLWGAQVFNPGPWAVRRMFKVLQQQAKILIQGCGAVGKSYNAMLFFYLDWLMDPEFTNIKIISTTKGHARSNTFSTLQRLHKQACIKLPGIVTGDYIGLDSRERKSGIAVIAIPTGDDGKGRLQGFHPDPRPFPHPILGPSSRVRAIMDECEEIPLGVWEGIANMLVSMEGSDTIKVVGAYNPKDQTSKTAQNAEPKDGWGIFDVETGVHGKDEWISRNGWYVLRIDGKKTENVQERRMRYPGFMSYTGYRELEIKDGGNSIEYYTFARGAYPPEGAVGVLISSKLINEARGEFVFVGAPIPCVGVDVAFDGRDNCVVTDGRTGLASGFQPQNSKLQKFKEPRRVLQIDQQLILPKGDVKKMGDAIKTHCLAMGVSPGYCTVDATGRGEGVWAYLRTSWGDDVQGVNFSANASEVKILEEDQRTPMEMYGKVVSEVWFAMQKWLEFGFLAFSPGIRREPLDAELAGRRYVHGKLKQLQVESKDDYKKRMGGKSPDFADSVSLICHGVRMRENLVGTMLEEPTPRRLEHTTPQHDEMAEAEWFQDAV